MQAARKLLSEGRWHFQHGPMDLILQAEGARDAVAQAHERAWQRFGGLLQELVNELPGLRAPVGAHCTLQGVVARRMWTACSPYRTGFITSMAAVAGSVAQEILACYEQPGIDRAWVNNGGDIALHLAPGQSVTVGVYADIAALNAAQLRNGLVLDGQIRIDSAMPVRGVATSGWRGRSQSLGIADSVTVLAHDAAGADAAATLIANEVNAEHAAIVRRPALELRDDSDLGEHLVTVQVGPLPDTVVNAALERGLACARRFQMQGRIAFAALSLAGVWRLTSPVSAQLPPSQWEHAA
jgi:hypothetical protein